VVFVRGASTSVPRLVGVPYRGEIYMVRQEWLLRRQRAKKLIIYTLLLALAAFMVGPLLLAFLSSFRAQALSWPPELFPPKFWPRNWVGAWNLGLQGGGNGWMGGWAPGHRLTFKVTFRYPQSQVAANPPLPQVVVLPPPMMMGGAKDPRPITQAEIEPIKERLTGQGLEVAYRVTLIHSGSERIPQLRLGIIGAPGSRFVEATLSPSMVSHRFSGTVLTWQNITPGILGYLFESYVQAWTTYKGQEGRFLFPRWVFNSLIVAIFKVVLTVLFSLMAGYALARLRFPGRNFLFLFAIFTMMVPGQVTFISNYILLRDGIFGISKLFGASTLINTYYALFLPGLVSAGSVFLMKQFMESIPRELEEAARIDGASSFQIFTRIIIPLSLPAMGALSILAFHGSWNEFFWPLVVLKTQEMWTLPIGLLAFRQFYGSVAGTNWNLVLAGAVISAIPVLVIFILFQRYFIEGVKLSGIKQ